MGYNWISLSGEFAVSDSTVTFTGGISDSESPAVSDTPQYRFGQILTDQVFGGGILSGNVTLHNEVHDNTACDFLLAYAPSTRAFLSAGIGGGSLASVRYFIDQWNTVGSIGSPKQLSPDRAYALSVIARGSNVTVALDGVNVLSVHLPNVLPNTQTGTFCVGPHNIEVSDFSVMAEKHTAFVVMQFTAPYNELYEEVIKPVCAELGIEAKRADETFGPGIIIADIARQISDAHIVIADVTPRNANVFYEVGYAHAINKPTILIAESRTELPFDVSPFRVLFYEDKIAGKRVVEEGLRNHLTAIQQAAGQLRTQ